MDNATIWNIIDKYFQDNPQALVRHHIDSFNDFYKNGIYQIFREKNPIVLYSKLDPNTNEYMSQCKMYMGGKDGSKIYFGKPVIFDNEKPHYMYPNEARLRDMNYSMTIHYDVDVEFIDQLLPGEVPTIIGGTHNDDEDEEEEDKLTLGEVIENDEFKKEEEEKQGEEVKTEGGSTPKTTKRKKKKEKDEMRLQITTKQAGKLRDMAEANISGNTQTRQHTLKKIYLGKFPIMLHHLQV